AGRLAELRGAPVYEVDYPGTQRLKRERIDGARDAGRRVFVPVDFEKDRLIDALPAAGLDRTAPSFWIWEGVTVYLTRDAVKATLAAIAALAPKKSRAAITYTEPHALGTTTLAFEALVRRVGEPLVGAIDRTEMHALLEQAGLVVRTDEGPRDW